MGQKSCRNEILFYKAQDLFESYPSLKLEIQESLLEFKAWVPIGCSPSRRKTFPGHTGYTLTNTVQDEIGFLCCEGVLLAVVHLGVQQDPPAFFSSELLPSQSPAMLLHGVIPFCVKDYIWFCCTS